MGGRHRNRFRKKKVMQCSAEHVIGSRATHGHHDHLVIRLAGEQRRHDLITQTP
jgi:hypothetical protein